MESKFTGSVIGFFGMKMLTVLMFFLGIVTFGITIAWVTMKFQRWVASHTWVDGRQLRFDGTTMSFWVQTLIWIFLSVITFGIYAMFFLSPRRQHWFARHTHFA